MQLTKMVYYPKCARGRCEEYRYERNGCRGHEELTNTPHRIVIGLIGTIVTAVVGSLGYLFLTWAQWWAVWGIGIAFMAGCALYLFGWGIDAVYQLAKKKERA